MKIAIVHDYIKEFGGAERVLEALSEIYPEAPIFTAFADKNSTAYQHFKDKKIITSWFNLLPFASKIASPFRFLTPFIWGSFNFKDYDLVISSASWFITKGFKKDKQKFIEICYCHTPPRWLYGYATSVGFQKYSLVKAYALIVGHFLRMYDFEQAQKVDYFIANSNEVKARIEKFYKKQAQVIYPPVSISSVTNDKKEDYYFIVSRIVGAKGLGLAVEAAKKMKIKLKIAGSKAGYYSDEALKKYSSSNIEFLGQVSDEDLANLYGKAKGFLALARDEDFGITPVEAQMAGTPVIAYNGGGYKESVVDGKTGVLFDEYSVSGLIDAINKFEKMRFNKIDLVKNAQRFSKERFEKEIKEFISKKVN